MPLNELLEDPPTDVVIRRVGDGVEIELEGRVTVALDPRRYEVPSRAGHPGCLLADVDLVYNQADYLMISLPSPGPGQTRHLRFAADIRHESRRWLAEVLQAAVARAKAHGGPDRAPPAELIELMGRDET